MKAFLAIIIVLFSLRLTSLSKNEECDLPTIFFIKNESKVRTCYFMQLQSVAIYLENNPLKKMALPTF